MATNQLIKYQHDNEKGLMHYIVYNDVITSLSVLDSLKVKYIKENKALPITFELKSTDFVEYKAKVILDEVILQDVYDSMNKAGNSYFKDGIKGLCVLQFSK